MTLPHKYITCVCYCWSSCCSDTSNFHRTSTCVVCLKVFSNSVAAVESQDTRGSKSCFRCCFQEQEKTPEVRSIYFEVTFPSLLFGTRVSSSLCRRADVDPQNEMAAVRGWPSGAACRWEKDQCPTSTKGEGGRGEGNNSCCTQKGRHQSPLERHSMCLAQTSWLTWQPGEVVHSLTDLRRRQNQSLRKPLAKLSDFGGPATHHSQHMFSRNGPP